MNLNFSPDLDAYFCYAVVFLCGLVSARIQIGKRLSDNNITNYWQDGSTWIMFLIYLSVPLCLFWLLDRLGALNDTSVFAAVIVGVTYPTILAGGYGPFRAPEGWAGIWKPIEGFTDTVVRRLVRRAARSDRRLEEFVVASMLQRTPTTDAGGSDGEPIFKAVLDFTRGNSAYVSQLDAKLKAIDQEKSSDAAAADVCRRKAKVIYLYLSAIPNFESRVCAELKSLKAFPRAKFFHRSPAFRSRITVVLVSLGFSLLVLLAAFYLLMSPTARLTYYTWRLEKEHNTAADVFRAQEAFRQFIVEQLPNVTLAADSEEHRTLREQAFHELSHVLRWPKFSPDRVDIVIDLLLEYRWDAATSDVVREQLIEGLHASSPDVRGRVHQALLLIAREDAECLENQNFPAPLMDEKLQKWNPTTRPSMVEVEEMANHWRNHFGFKSFHPTLSGLTTPLSKTVR